MLPNPIFASELHPHGIPPEQVVSSRGLTLQPQPIFATGICHRDAPRERHVSGQHTTSGQCAPVVGSEDKEEKAPLCTPIFAATLRQHLGLKPSKTEQNGSVATLSFQ
jgi:hypothetical protein